VSLTVQIHSDTDQCLYSVENPVNPGYIIGSYHATSQRKNWSASQSANHVDFVRNLYLINSMISDAPKKKKGGDSFLLVVVDERKKVSAIQGVLFRSRIR
jgi:hypothetical protein